MPLLPNISNLKASNFKFCRYNFIMYRADLASHRNMQLSCLSHRSISSFANNFKKDFHSVFVHHLIVSPLVV